nr:MAG TPA: hypothetical protein [Caudoviricetes sp.]
MYVLIILIPHYSVSVSSISCYYICIHIYSTLRKSLNRM